MLNMCVQGSCEPSAVSSGAVLRTAAYLGLEPLSQLHRHVHVGQAQRHVEQGVAATNRHQQSSVVPPKRHSV